MVIRGILTAQAVAAVSLDLDHFSSLGDGLIEFNGE
jgi:hypothetical protein